MNFFLILLVTLLSLFNLIESKTHLNNKQKSFSDGHCGQGYCFSAIYTPQHNKINYTLYVFEGGKQIGWYGIAQGKGMIGANMAINWINSDLTLTTSHRSTKEYKMPLTSKVTIKKFSLNPSIEKTKKGLSIFSWNMPKTKDRLNAVQHVFAHSPISPSSSSVDAIIHKHDRHEVGIVLDLTRPCFGFVPKNILQNVPRW